MISAQRITVAGKLPFENAQILSVDEQASAGIDNYFEEDQLVIKCKEGTFILPSYKITLVLLNRSTKKLSPEVAKKIKRLTIAGELTFCPAYVVHSGMQEQAGIPPIFKSYAQFSFACGEGLYVTNDFNVTMMEL